MTRILVFIIGLLSAATLPLQATMAAQSASCGTTDSAASSPIQEVTQMSRNSELPESQPQNAVSKLQFLKAHAYAIYPQEKIK